MNLYPAYGNGRFSETSWTETTYSLIQPAGVYSYVLRKISVPFSFRSSPSAGRFRTTLISNGQATFQWDLRAFNTSHPAKMFDLIPGRKYRFRCYVKSDAGVELTNNDNSVLSIGPTYDVPVSGYGSNGMLETLVTKTIGQTKTGWQLLECVITEQDSRVPISLFIHTAGGISPTYGGAVAKVGQLAQNNLLERALFIDDITVEEIATTCTTSFPLAEPFYIENESEVDANDGKITFAAVSSYGFPLEFSIDNGVTFQSSNVFENLAPGIYDGVVRELNPFVTPCVYNFADIIILEANPEEPPLVPQNPDVLNVLARVNQYNYLRWFAAQGNLSYNSLGCVDESDLPNDYVKHDNSEFTLPVVCNDEQFSFFLNFTNNYTNPVFARMRLAIGNEYGIVQTNIATLQQDVIDGIMVDPYNVYAQVTLSNVPNGKYFFVIYDSLTSNMYFVSSKVRVMDLAEAKKKTVRIQFRSSIDLYKYRYNTTALQNWLNTIRLVCNKVDDQFEGELSQYRAASTGILRNVSYELDFFVKLETLYFSDELHKFMGVLQAHDLLNINGKLYLPKDLYKKETNKELNANIGTWELYEQAFSSSNRYGKLTDITIIGSNDDLLSADNGQFIKI
jgi:uncharacterized protein YecE (DUF72 family)